MARGGYGWIEGEGVLLQGSWRRRPDRELVDMSHRLQAIAYPI